MYPFGVGEPNSASLVGQTFLAPQNTLDSWTFYFSYSSGTSAVDFRFGVMAWDAANSRGAGSLLYQSGILTIVPQTPFLPYTVTPNLALTVGAHYVVFADQAGLNSGEYANGALGTAFVTVGFPNAPLGGSIVHAGSGGNSNFTQLTTQPWAVLHPMQAAYTADFSTRSAVGIPDSGPTFFLASATWLLMVMLARARRCGHTSSSQR